MALLADAAEAVAAWRRAQARVVAVVGELERAGVAGETGYRSTARLLTDRVRIDGREAKALVDDAGLLADRRAFTGEPLPPRLPATSEALRVGDIDRGHVHVIATAMRALERVSDLPPAVCDETERQLAGLATRLTPNQLAHDAAELLRRLDPDGQLPPEADRPIAEVHLTTGLKGELSGRFRFADPDVADVIRAAIDALTPPPDPDADTTVLRPSRTLPERRAAALHDLAADAVGDPAGAPGTSDDEAGTSDGDATEDASGGTGSADGDRGAGRSARRTGPRTQGGDAVGLIVTVPLDVLQSANARGGFGLLDGQWALRPETLRRLACDASVIPAVLGARGEVLDLGRASRTVSTAQRRAVITRDRHCAHPGCRRRPRRCQVHHVVPWAQGGSSDLDNLVLLCAYHHHLVHHSGWQIEMRHRRPVFVPPLWLDPGRVPRSNDVDHLVAA